MKKSLLFALMICLLVFSASNATLTRVLAMGDNNMIIIDEENISIFPSRIVDYPDQAIGDFDTTSFHRFGIHWLVKEDNKITR